jgi:uncharacterized protein (TIGR00369 family)
MPRMTAAEIDRFIDATFPQAREQRTTIEEIGERRIRVRLLTDERNLRPGGTLSGPTLMTLADTTMYFLVLAMIGPVALAVTTHLSINFLRRPAPGDVIAEGEMLKLGKRLAVGHVTLYSGGDREPLAHVQLTYSLPTPAGRPT